MSAFGRHLELCILRYDFDTSACWREAAQGMKLHVVLKWQQQYHSQFACMCMPSGSVDEPHPLAGMGRGLLQLSMLFGLISQALKGL